MRKSSFCKHSNLNSQTPNNNKKLINLSDNANILTTNEAQRTCELTV